eukprot:scaffold909_cov135-Cylindrotheca_fusiformis.AAC.7
MAIILIAAVMLLMQTMAVEASHSSAMMRPEMHQREDGEAQSNLLLVGNSYTSSNGLMFTLESMLRHGRSPTAFVASSTLDGAHLSAFSNPIDGFLGLLRNRSWNWVVLQEQSEVPGLYYTEYASEWFTSVEALLNLTHAIYDAGSQPILFQTWGRLHHDDNPTETIHMLYNSYDHHQSRIVEGYNKYQKMLAKVGRPALIAPVGLAFKAIHDSMIEQGRDPEDSDGEFALLYDEDGSHPSARGSYLAACVIIGTITGDDVTQYTWEAPALSEGTRERLRRVAATTVSNFCQNCTDRAYKEYIPKDHQSSSNSSSLLRYIFLFSALAAAVGLAWKNQHHFRHALTPLIRRNDFVGQDDFGYAPLSLADDAAMVTELTSSRDGFRTG